MLRNASVTPQSVLSLPQERVESLAANELPVLAGRGLGAWVSEFNMVDRTPGLTFAGTWTHGLFIAAYALLLAQRRTVTSLNLHNVVGDALAGVLWDTTEGFREPTPATQLFARSAMGSTYAVLARAALGATAAQTLTMPGGPTLASGAAGLVGMHFTGASHQAVIVNLAPVALTLDMNAVFGTDFSWTRLTAPSLSTRIPGPGALATATGTSTGVVSLPRHSVLRLSA